MSNVKMNAANIQWSSLYSPHRRPVWACLWWLRAASQSAEWPCSRAVFCNQRANLRMNWEGRLERQWKHKQATIVQVITENQLDPWLDFNFKETKEGEIFPAGNNLFRKINKAFFFFFFTVAKISYNVFIKVSLIYSLKIVSNTQ